MELILTIAQLNELEQEKIKEENRLETIPKSGHGWERIDCIENIQVLEEILKNKKINIYNLS